MRNHWKLIIIYLSALVPNNVIQNGVLAEKKGIMQL